MKIKKSRYTKKSGKISPSDVSNTQSIMDKRPKFSLKYLGGQHCLSRCTKDEKAAFADRIHRLSQQTWSQIFQGGRHGGGFEKINEPLSWMPDKFSEKQIIAFRFSGMKAMLGFSDKEIFYILGLDRDFTSYGH